MGDANDAAQVRLAALAEFAVSALRDVERNNVISSRNTGDALANAFDDARPLVTENDGEDRFRVLSRQQMRIRVAQGRAYDSNANLALLWGCDVDILHDCKEKRGSEGSKLENGPCKPWQATLAPILVYEPKGVLAAHATARNSEQSTALVVRTEGGKGGTSFRLG